MKSIIMFLVIWGTMAAAIVALCWFACWQNVLQNQWLTQPFVHYEWWQFIFAWNQAWAWLWFVNFPLWLTVVGVVALIIGFIIALFLSQD